MRAYLLLKAPNFVLKDALGMQMDFPTLPGSHRILNVHQNVPGVLKNVNNIIADLNVNIKAQVCILIAGSPPHM